MQSVAGLAHTLVDGVGIVTHMLHIACAIVGFVLLVTAIALLKAHRDNPKYVPLDRPVAYVCLAVILLGMPFLRVLFGPTASNIDVKQQASQHALVAAGVGLDADQVIFAIDDIDSPINGTLD